MPEQTKRDVFRKDSQPMSEETKAQVRDLKDKADELLLLVEQFGMSNPNREKSLAITKLEECVMWAVKGITQ